MQDIFITNIRIDKIRHLRDINIALSSDTKKHLILTGKNGCGKTSLLEVLKRKIAEPARISMGDLVIEIDGMIPDEAEENKVTFNREDYQPFQWEKTNNVFVFCSAERGLKLDLPRAIETVNVSKPIMLDKFAGKSFVQYMLYLNYQKMAAIANNDKIVQKKSRTGLTGLPRHFAQLNGRP